MKSFSFFTLKSLFFLSILLVSMSELNAQDDKVNAPKTKSDFWKKVRFGGGFSLNPGNGSFNATLAPSAIYQFNNSFAVGVGLTGTYSSVKNISNSVILGGSIISLYSPIKEIQLSAEFEEVNVSRKFKGDFAELEDDNYWYPALFVGAGYRTNFATIGIRYDLLYDENTSVFQNAWAPFVRVYF